MKLSIVIICWNDLQHIGPCLRSVYAETRGIDFEVIVTDNGSTDGSLEYLQEHFPSVRIVANGANLGFGPGNNAGFKVARGEYVLILNPDTVIHDRAIEKLVAYADRQPEAGAFGCRTLNVDGSLQGTAHPKPTLFRFLIKALYLRWLGRLAAIFLADEYVDWNGRTERKIGYQAGCSLLIRTELLRALGGFDESFFHQFEDADLCHRVWESGKSVLFYPESEVTHIGGQNRGRYPMNVILETERSKYKYFYKHYGVRGAIGIRIISLIHWSIRYTGYSALRFFRRTEALESRLKMYRVLLAWNWRLHPLQFVTEGQEPDVGYEPLGGRSAAAKLAGARSNSSGNA
jgi:GT2 family glycosyltransferase